MLISKSSYLLMLEDSCIGVCVLLLSKISIQGFVRSSMVHISISLTPASYYNHEIYLSIISSTYSTTQFLLLLVTKNAG